MKSLSSFFFIILFITSCQLENDKTIVEVNKENTKVEKNITKVKKKIVEFVNVNKLNEKKQKKIMILFFI